MLCLRDEIFNKINDSPLKMFLMLLSCAFCDSCKEKDTIVFDSKYQSLFVLPIFAIARNMGEEHVLFRTISIVMLEKVQDMFGGNSTISEKEIANFIKAHNDNVHDNDEKKQQNKLVNLYQSISECSYLELIKRIVFDEQYSIALNMAMNFFSFNVEIGGHGFYYCYSYKRGRKETVNDDIFFEVGRMLDEGATEWLTQEICSKSDKSIAFDEARYHTEVSYIKKIFEKYSEKKVVSAYMGSLSDKFSLDFFYDITKASDKCDFYHIFKFTDCQDWRAAISLLNKLPQIGESEEQ
jgi:hypothetical protein